MGINKETYSNISHLDTSPLVWLITQRVKEIYYENQNTEIIVSELIELKKEISDFDYSLKLKFKIAKESEKNIASSKNQAIVEGWIDQAGKFLLNCETSDQYRNLNKTLQLLLSFIEKEINNLTGEPFDTTDDPENLKKLTKYDADKMGLFLKLLEQQDILRSSNVTKANFITQFAGISIRSITDSLSSIKLDAAETNQQHLIGIEKDLKDILLAINQLKYPMRG